MSAERRLPDLGFSCLASSVFLALLWINGPVNIEQYQHSGPATHLFHSSLLQGRFLFWTHSFGLGTPLPLGENFYYHPFFILQPLVPLAWILRCFWLFHATLGAWYTMRLCRLAGSGTWAGHGAVLAFTFSAPAANYTYTDDWPAVFLGWTLLPMVAFYAGRLCLDLDSATRLRSAALLTLALTFALWNSHLGYWVSQAIPLMVWVLGVATGRRWRLLVVFACILTAAVLVAGDRVVFLLDELARFPAHLKLRTQQPLTWAAWTGELIRPVDGKLLDLLVHWKWHRALSLYLDSKSQMRIPYVGLVFGISALLGLTRSLRLQRSTAAARIQQGLACAFASGVLLSVLPARYLLDLPSGMWLCRDAAIFFGLVTASWWLTELLSATARRPRWRLFLLGLLVLQWVQLALVAAPPLLHVVRHREANVDFYRAPRVNAVVDWLTEAVPDRPARVYLSPSLARELLSERALLRDFGWLGTGDLARFGLLPVGGYFKNVSMDVLYPSFKRLGGLIGSESAVIADPLTFDVLSIEYLLAFDDEPNLDLSHLKPSGSVLPSMSSRRLRAYRNLDAWPQVQLYPAAVARLEPRPRTDCGVPGLLCADFHPLARRRLPDQARLEVDHDRLRIEIEPGASERLAVLTHLYRPAWRAEATDGSSLETLAVQGALLAVKIPPGVAQVRLAYRPTLRRALAFSGLTIWLLIALWVLVPTRLAVSIPSDGVK